MAYVTIRFGNKTETAVDIKKAHITGVLFPAFRAFLKRFFEPFHNHENGDRVHRRRDALLHVAMDDVFPLLNHYNQGQLLDLVVELREEHRFTPGQQVQNKLRGSAITWNRENVAVREQQATAQKERHILTALRATPFQVEELGAAVVAHLNFSQEILDAIFSFYVKHGLEEFFLLGAYLPEEEFDKLLLEMVEKAENHKRLEVKLWARTQRSKFATTFTAIAA